MSQVFAITILLISLTFSSSSSSTPSTSVLESARAFSAAIDVIRRKAEAADVASLEADSVQELASSMDTAFSAYFDLEMLIASKVVVDG